MTGQTNKVSFIGQPQHATLMQAGALIKLAFGHPPYLVGSATHRADWRDIDIRLILPDAEFDGLFGKGANDVLSARLSLINAGITRQLSSMTGGLPIDFQIQRMTEANQRYDGPREPLGMFQRSLAYIGGSAA
jgi:hypothetical protein